VQLQDPTAGTGSTAAVTQTDSTGQFTFSGIPAGNWKVQPQKNGDLGSAIDILDAVSVLQAAAGTISMGPQQQLACDVNGDGSVDTADAVLIMQYTVGVITRFPVAQTCGSDWAFVPEPAPAANQQVVSPQIGTAACQNGAIGFAPLTAQASNQDFSAILFGDCTGNWLRP
jgi:hypothetical protein